MKGQTQTIITIRWVGVSLNTYLQRGFTPVPDTNIVPPDHPQVWVTGPYLRGTLTFRVQLPHQQLQNWANKDQEGCHNWWMSFKPWVINMETFYSQKNDPRDLPDVRGCMDWWPCSPSSPSCCCLDTINDFSLWVVMFVKFCLEKKSMKSDVRVMYRVTSLPQPWQHVTLTDIWDFVFLLLGWKLGK